MQKMKSNPPKTVLTICVGFLLIYAKWSYDWILMATIVMGLAAVFSDKLSRRIEQAWMKLAWALGEVIPKITLTPVFYLLLFPLALISRVFGPKDPMHIKSSGDSLFKDVDKSFDKKSFENPW